MVSEKRSHFDYDLAASGQKINKLREKFLSSQRNTQSYRHGCLSDIEGPFFGF